MCDENEWFVSGRLAPDSGVYLAKFADGAAMHVMFKKDEEFPRSSDMGEVKYSLAMLADHASDVLKLHKTFP